MPNRRVTIKDIAAELGLSVGIINRALNGKSGVSPKTKALVLDTAERMGYRVNRVAQGMARATISLAILLPTEWESYYSLIRRGIEEELDRLLDYNVEGIFYPIDAPFSHECTANALERALADGVNGVLLSDVYPTGLGDSLARLKAAKIPVVTIGGADYDEELFLSSVCTDARVSGEMAAELLSLSLGGKGSVAIYIGSCERTEHREKLRGFTERAEGSGLSPVRVYETMDDEATATALFEKMLSGEDLPRGVYLATAATDGILSLMKQRTPDVRLVATDVTPMAAECLEAGIIQAVLYQNPIKQGRLAIRALYGQLSGERTPEREIRVSPRVVLSSNLGEYRE